MNFLALAITILGLYSPLRGYSSEDFKNLNSLQQAILEDVESRIVKCVESNSPLRLSEELKSDLMSFLREHSENNQFNRESLEQFSAGKISNEMVNDIFEIYGPVAVEAKTYDVLDSVGKSRVRCKEDRIINRLKTKYKVSLDRVDVGDFRVLIREHGQDTKLNRKLVKRFFVGCKTKIFDKIASFMNGSKSGPIWLNCAGVCRLTPIYLVRQLGDHKAVIKFQCIYKKG